MPSIAVAPIGSDIVDYFFIAGCSDDDVQLALKENIAVDELSAVVLDRFPQEERPFPGSESAEVSELPLGAPIFCFPLGFNAFIEGDSDGESAPADVHQPGRGQFHSFVLTGGDGTRSYGACLQFIEKHTNGNIVVMVPKVMCVLSQYGYFSMFQKFLESLYRSYVLGIVDDDSTAGSTTTTTSAAGAKAKAAAKATSTASLITSAIIIPLEAEI